jgi:hypothetical protein
MTPKMEFIGSQWDVRAAATRYLLSASGTKCEGKDIPLTLLYRHTNNTWQPLDSRVMIHGQNKQLGSMLLFSGYFRPTQYFEGFSTPTEFKDCFFKLEQIIGDSRLPYFFTSSLPPIASHNNYFKGIGSFR